MITVPTCLIDSIGLWDDNFFTDIENFENFENFRSFSIKSPIVSGCTCEQTVQHTFGLSNMGHKYLPAVLSAPW